MLVKLTIQIRLDLKQVLLNCCLRSKGASRLVYSFIFIKLRLLRGKSRGKNVSNRLLHQQWDGTMNFYLVSIESTFTSVLVTI